MSFKKFILFVVSAFVFQSAGQEEPAAPATPRFDMMLAPTISVYAEEIQNCDVSDLSIGSVTDVKEICQALVDSPICEEIDPDYKMNCNRIYYDPAGALYENPDNPDKKWFPAAGQYEVAHDNFVGVSAPWNCLKGVAVGAADVVTFLAVMVAGAVMIPVGLVWENSMSESMYESMRSLGNYWMAEYDKEVLEGQSFSPLITSLGNIIGNSLSETYNEFACLNPEGKWKMICEVGFQAGTFVGLGGLGLLRATGKISTATLLAPITAVKKVGAVTKIPKKLGQMRRARRQAAATRRSQRQAAKTSKAKAKADAKASKAKAKADAKAGTAQSHSQSQAAKTAAGASAKQAETAAKQATEAAKQASSAAAASQGAAKQASSAAAASQGAAAAGARSASQEGAKRVTETLSTSFGTIGAGSAAGRTVGTSRAGQAGSAGGAGAKTGADAGAKASQAGGAGAGSSGAAATGQGAGKAGQAGSAGGAGAKTGADAGAKAGQGTGSQQPLISSSTNVQKAKQDRMRRRARRNK